MNERERNFLYQVTRNLIENDFPEEFETFNVLWESFEEVYGNQIAHWSDSGVKEKRLTVLDPSVVSDLMTHIALGVLTGLLARFTYDGIRKIVKKRSPELRKTIFELCVIYKTKKEIGLKIEYAIINHIEKREVKSSK